MSTTAPGNSPQPNADRGMPPMPGDAEAQAIMSKIGRSWYLVLILGIISLIVGLIILWQPSAAVRVAALIFGAWLLVSGIFQLAQSFDARLETSARVLGAISGSLGVILGIICFKSVENRITLLILFIGIWWIMRGLIQLIAGVNGGGGFVIFLGILGIIAGTVVLVSPIHSLAVLTGVVGCWLLVLGTFEIIASFRLKSINAKVDAA